MRGLFLLEESGKLLLKAREPTAAVDQLLLAASPRGVRFRVNIKVQGVAFLPPGGAGGELGAIGHDDLDLVIIRMSIGFHGFLLRFVPRSWFGCYEMLRLYNPRKAGQTSRVGCLSC